MSKLPEGVTQKEMDAYALGILRGSTEREQLTARIAELEAACAGDAVRATAFEAMEADQRETIAMLAKARALIEGMATQECDNFHAPVDCQEGYSNKDFWCYPCRARAFLAGQAGEAKPLTGPLVRCASVSGEGWRCGLQAGHEGNHTVLAPSDAPWFDADQNEEG